MAGHASHMAASVSGRYLAFKLSNELYGLPILKVQEIIVLMKITRIPKAPPFVLGCVNLRGRVVPVIGLRQKFGLPESPDTSKTCIVVVQLAIGGEHLTIGVVVDEVCEVMNLSDGQIAPPPALGSAIDISFIMGVGKVGSSVVMLLDLEKAFSIEELGGLKSVS